MAAQVPAERGRMSFTESEEMSRVLAQNWWVVRWPSSAIPAARRGRCPTLRVFAR